MATTRAQVEQILVQRTSRLMIAAGLDGTTVDGTNISITDPIWFGLTYLGFTPSVVTSISDSEISQVDPSNVAQLIDLAELRLLRTILQNLDEVDITLGPRTERFSQLSEQVRKIIASKEAQISSDYGISGNALTPAVVELDFIQEEDEPS